MERTNCPNCGAPLPYFPNHHCEYCGTNIPKEPQIRSGIIQTPSSITLYCESFDGDYSEIWADNRLMARIPKTAFV